MAAGEDVARCRDGVAVYFKSVAGGGTEIVAPAVGCRVPDVGVGRLVEIPAPGGSVVGEDMAVFPKVNRLGFSGSSTGSGIGS